ncbi:MAG: DUF1460 domain-containing protein [Desulfuromonadales bacterium]|nr:DUF1460 domain-containing protein [Desulfuromonadales bacterium]
MPIKIPTSILLLLILLACVALAAEQKSVQLGRWTDPELSRIISTAHAIDPPGERIAALSAHFLTTPYVANTLVGGPHTAEQLVINLAGFDCFTFLDTIEALRRADHLADFSEQLKQVRYRGGEVTYANRRHFFSDWVADDSRALTDVTAAVGAGRVQVVVKQLNRKNDGTDWLSGLPVTRREIVFIPTSAIDRTVVSALKAGDYVGIYSARDGLDVSHTGLLVPGQDGFLLRHASSLNGVSRVVDVDLLVYLQGKPGMVVYRAR